MTRRAASPGQDDPDIGDLIIAVLAIAAGFRLLQNHKYGRVIGYIFALVTMVEGFIVLFYAPWYGAAAILLGVLVAYGLAVTQES